jgi:hypothetical protein
LGINRRLNDFRLLRELGAKSFADFFGFADEVLQQGLIDQISFSLTYRLRQRFRQRARPVRSQVPAGFTDIIQFVLSTLRCRLKVSNQLLLRTVEYLPHWCAEEN